MTQPGTPGAQIPANDVDALARRLRDMEREIASLKANALGRNGISVNNAAGGLLVRIGEIFSGLFGLRIRYPSGQTQMWAGETSPGVVQTLFYRSTGALALAIGGNAGGHQYAAIYDRSGNAVLSDDTISGAGIGSPFVPFGPFMATSAPTDTTSSPTFVTLQTSQGYKMNPRVTAQVLARTSDGTTAGEVRFVDETLTQIGSTIVIPAGAFNYYNLPATTMTGSFMNAKTIQLQARVTAGAGTLGVRGMFVQGVQS